MPKLMFQNGECAGRVCELEDGIITVGRDETNRIMLDDLTVSRKHCELLVYSPEILVRDLNSTNGTLVHDRMLNGSQWQVLSGQVIQLGLVSVRLELEPPPRDRGATTAVLEFREYMEVLSKKPALKLGPSAAFSPEIRNPVRAAMRTSLLARSASAMSSATTQFIRGGAVVAARRNRFEVWIWIAAGLLLWGFVVAFLLL